MPFPSNSTPTFAKFTRNFRETFGNNYVTILDFRHTWTPEHVNSLFFCGSSYKLLAIILYTFGGQVGLKDHANCGCGDENPSFLGIRNLWFCIQSPQRKLICLGSALEGSGHCLGLIEVLKDYMTLARSIDLT